MGGQGTKKVVVLFPDVVCWFIYPADAAMGTSRGAPTAISTSVKCVCGSEKDVDVGEWRGTTFTWYTPP
jgi:hypothetical protein